MPITEVPTEIELLYQIKPCADEHSAQVADRPPLPCAYFRKWGIWHSFDYEPDAPMMHHEIGLKSAYVGRRPLVAEALSGCRKAPIMAVGINPNLPGWNRPNSVNPLFDEVQEFAHYFRYRANAKLDIPLADYERFGGDAKDPPLSTAELAVPMDADGHRTIPLEPRPVPMYQGYEALLADMAEAMDWNDAKPVVGEDLSYGNMIGCPSAKWLLKPYAQDPRMPPMARTEMEGIVVECFVKRQYFLRQLAHSMPAVLLVISQATTDAFLEQMNGNFSLGAPKVGETVEALVDREIRLKFGDTEHEARVIFSPHITGNPHGFKVFRPKVLAQLIDEAKRGGIAFNKVTGRLSRTKGPCTLCPTMAIGACEYAGELQPHAITTMADATLADVSLARSQKQFELGIVRAFLERNAAAKAAPSASSLSTTEAANDGWVLAAEHEQSS
ncbi:conserved hypothetical protein [Mesorhizobium sp. ORS 3324]|nr:conserved hypothetical protein [Mesorhizobium sp. ORS 3324]